MPNQYTKFKAAVQNSEHREFRWREWDSKKQRRPKAGPKKRTSKEINNAKPHQPNGDSVYDPVAIIEHIAKSNSSLVQYMPSGGLRIDPFKAFPVNPNKSELVVLDHCMFMHQVLSLILIVDSSPYLSTLWNT